MNGYNFTERVRKVLAMAREESARLRHEYVGTEHILLGLIREGDGLGATVLQHLHVDLAEVRWSIESVVKKGRAGENTGPDLPYTSRAKKVLELAMTEARELNHTYVGTEHLLLGLIREGSGIAAQVLHERGVNSDNARAEVLRILDTEMDGRTLERAPMRRTANDSMHAVAQPQLAERVRDVMRDAEDVATECGANELKPIHVAIALLRHGEGFANAVLNRLDADSPALIRALMNEAKNDKTEPATGVRLEFGKYMVAFQRQVESEARWRHSPPTTLNVLLALLDSVRDVALVFETQGIDAARVRAEARRMSG